MPPLRSAVFLRTRVARRILGLFLLSAILPIAGLASVAYRQVAGELQRQAQDRLVSMSKAEGLALLGRLAVLDAELELLASEVAERGAAGAALTSRVSDRFRAIALYAPAGPPTALLGAMDGPPPLTPLQVEHLAGGGAVVATARRADVMPVLMATRIGAAGGGGTLWAEVDPEYLWTADLGRAGRITRAEMCVLDQERRPLFCPGAWLGALKAIDFAALGSQGGGFVWPSGDEAYVAAYRGVFLGFAYAGQNWTIVLREPRATVIAPIAKFTRTFSLVTLLALLVVVFLSNTQIRRSLDPLFRLKQGTLRVAARDFDTQVEVRSGDEFEELATSFNTMAGRVKQHVLTMAAINEIDRAVLSALDQHTIVETILSRACEILPCDRVHLGVAAGVNGSWTFRGVSTATGGRTSRTISLVPTDLDALRRHPEGLVVDDAARRPPLLRRLLDHGMPLRSALVVPVLRQAEILAIIALESRTDFTADDARHVRQLADQVGVALSNCRLMEELEALKLGALTAFARTIDAKSPWTAGHSERVTELACQTASHLGLSVEDVERVRRGGLLHDIGKIGVPAEVLDKRGRLTDDEYRIIQTHPTIGADILWPIAAYHDVIPMVKHHHERYDGKGYPDGLAGDGIAAEARLLAVADVFDALVSDRPYREGWPLARVRRLIAEEAGKHFDPDFARAFLAAVPNDLLASISGYAGLFGHGSPGAMPAPPTPADATMTFEALHDTR